MYPALEQGVIDAAVTFTDAAFGLKWYEVSNFLTGPISSVQLTWLTMNRDHWNALPIGFQEIIQEEAVNLQEETLRLSTTDWLKQGIQANIDQGMEYTELTPELHAAFRQAAISSVLPNWVKRVGGPGSPEVTFFNKLVGPIVGIQVNPDGTVSDISPAPDLTIQTPLVRRPIPTGPELNFLGTGIVGDELSFDVDWFSVKTGSVVVMTFKNASQVNPHNWVLVKAGTKDAVAAAGAAAGPENDWVAPGDDRVVARIRLLDPGESGQNRFVAPAVGKYQFVCTFPGHNVTMFGDFEVVQ